MGDSDVFRTFYEAWSDGDLERVLEIADPEIVARPVHGPLYSRSEYHGRGGIEQWYREMTEPWDRYQTVVEEVQDTPEGAMGVLRLVAHRDHETFEARLGVVCELRDEHIVSLIARDVWEVEEELGV